MIYPSIKNYRESRRNHFIAPLSDRKEFLGRNALDVRWHTYEPKVNIVKKDNLYEMEITMPGFNKEDIDVSIKDEILTIRAERKTEKATSEYILREFDHDVMERTFYLRNDIGREQVTASYKNGILTIVFIDVPESEEESNKIVTVD